MAIMEKNFKLAESIYLEQVCLSWHDLYYYLTWLMPSHSQWGMATYHSTLSSSVLSCHLHLSPAVPEACHQHFLLQISSPGSSSSSVVLWLVNTVIRSPDCVSKPFPLFLPSCCCTGSSPVFFHSSLLYILSPKNQNRVKNWLSLIEWLDCVFSICSVL